MVLELSILIFNTSYHKFNHSNALLLTFSLAKHQFYRPFTPTCEPCIFIITQFGKNINEKIIFFFFKNVFEHKSQNHLFNWTLIIYFPYFRSWDYYCDTRKAGRKIDIRRTFYLRRRSGRLSSRSSLTGRCNFPVRDRNFAVCASMGALQEVLVRKQGDSDLFQLKVKRQGQERTDKPKIGTIWMKRKHRNNNNDKLAVNIYNADRNELMLK